MTLSIISICQELATTNYFTRQSLLSKYHTTNKSTNCMSFILKSQLVHLLVVWYLVNLQDARCNNKDNLYCIYTYVVNQQSHTGKTCLTCITDHLHHQGASTRAPKIINKLLNCISEITWCCSAYLTQTQWFKMSYKLAIFLFVDILSLFLSQHPDDGSKRDRNI